MKASVYSTIALVSLLVACVGCEPPTPNPTIIEDTLDVSITLSGEYTTVIDGEAQTMPNDIQGGLLDGCTHGLATGTYFSGSTKIVEIWRSWIPVLMQYYYDTLTWAGANVTYTGGNGLCDSVRFTTTNQTIEGSPLDDWYLRKATLGKTLETYLISKEEYTGVGDGGLDTAYGGDAVYVIWEITANKLGSAAHYGLYDTTGYKLIQGLASGTASKISYAKFYYANGDTNQVMVDPSSITYNCNGDTSWANVQFTTYADTTRTAVDTCVGMDVFFQDNKYCLWDTLPVPMPANSAIKKTFRIQVLR